MDFAIGQRGEPMDDLISRQKGMVRELKEYFKEYKGCRNCKYQPEPLQMCEWGKRRQCVELICSGWGKKDE